MKTAEAVLGNLAGLLWGNWMLFVLLGLGVFYTIATGCIQFRSIPWIIKEFCKKEDRTEPSRNHKGTVSSVQALYMAIASCVGSGNIVGVATALIGGGPGALFWMWAAAFLGMATKYAEIVLGLVFRQKGVDGSYYGGPMYYIEKGLHTRCLGVAAAVLLFFQNAGGTLIQSNTISGAAYQVFGVPKLCTGVVLAAAMIFIIGGGLKRLADTAQKVVPIMASLYIVGGAVVVFANLESHAEPHFPGSMFHEGGDGGRGRADNEGGHAVRRGQGTVFQRGRRRFCGRHPFRGPGRPSGQTGLLRCGGGAGGYHGYMQYHWLFHPGKRCAPGRGKCGIPGSGGIRNHISFFEICGFCQPDFIRFHLHHEPVVFWTCESDVHKELEGGLVLPYAVSCIDFGRKPEHGRNRVVYPGLYAGAFNHSQCAGPF